jgi:acylphosphatase
MKKTVQITVQGKVQGVYFRHSARIKAEELGICGTARNLANGDVCIEAEGEETILQEFINWCKEGPINALVTKIQISEISNKGFYGFQIIR